MRNRFAVLAVAAVLPLTGAISLGAAGQAAAATPPGKVVLKGMVDDCEDDSSPAKVSIKTSREAFSRNVSATNEYSITFKQIPAKGRLASAVVTCDSKATYTQTFRINGSPNSNTVTQDQDLEP